MYTEKYLQDVFQKARSKVREESYYSLVEDLLTGFAVKNKYKIKVDTFPKKTEAGNPDIRVLSKKGDLVGYIEGKDFGKELENIENTEQIKRYRSTFPNLILTNFLEFRLYRDGELIELPVKISDPHPFLRLKLKKIPVQNEDKLLSLLVKFLSFSTPQTTSAKALAVELAKRTRFLRDQVIAEEIKEEKIKGTQTLEGFYKAFKDHLISTLTLKDFSNLFAQTITYGLFTARSRTRDSFNRKLAYDHIPHTIGILRDVFRFISSADLPPSMEWIIDDIAEVLDAANVNKIMHDFYKEGKGKDPIIHFYETFLAEYDPAERERRGVYYTPEPVVSYIVRSIHKLLKEKFGKEDGFATQSVTVLDPAAGTLTFPVYAIQEAVEEYKNKYGKGGVKGLIKDHILKNYYAFELMMAPYSVGHLKMGFVLDELGYKLGEDERFKLYLTNTLESKDLTSSEIPGLISLSAESILAGKVKRDVPILVIMGNPPYSSSKSKGTEFINKLMKDYMAGLGVEEEKKKGALQDDYVRFIRFAHWKINEKGKGLVGIITNNSYLNGVLHRSMRKQLLESFDEIYILNLHGDSRIGEVAPNERKDENVFDIQQGVAIILALKKEKTTGDNKTKYQLYYSDLWGSRNDKYRFLNKSNLNKTDWESINVESVRKDFMKTRWSRKHPEGFYFFNPHISKNVIKYGNFIGLDELFTVYGTGIETHRDKVAIHFTKESLKNVLITIENSSDEELKLVDYNISFKKLRDLRSELSGKDKPLTEILFKPFDNRWTYLNNNLVARPKVDLMSNMFEKDSLAIVTTRQTKEPFGALISNTPIAHKVVASYDKSYIFPLFKRNNFNNNLFEEDNNNLDKDVLKEIGKYLNVKDSKLIIYYIYSILYSQNYRYNYQEFLRFDYPRIPFTKDFKLFQNLVKIGGKLVELHLLKSKELNKPISKFSIKNGREVKKREFNEKEKRIYINESQYFKSVEPEVWNYHIGGYQVLDKWLKDRAGRSLSSEEIKHYCKVVTAIAKTIEIQKEIDKLYPKVEKSLLAF